MSYKNLQDKRVVITGGASGIGFATAKRFTDEGAKVVIFDINENAIEQALADNSAIHGGVKVDVSSEESVVEGFKKVDELMDGIDVLISNAGISLRRNFVDISYGEWKKVMDINLGGMFLCAKESILRMEKQKSGVLLFTASTNGITSHPLYADYNASKAGVIQLVKDIAMEYAPWLRVNSVSPGYVLTPMQKSEYSEEMLQVVNDGIPMKRHADPDEIASLFAFLSSDDASYITGQNIPIDGGEIC